MTGKGIVIELTNRCNLSCNHCFTGRHGGSDHLPIGILEKVVTEAGDRGFDKISFTGGDPTVYRHLADAVRLVAEGGFTWSMVTNGWSFRRVYPDFLPYRDALGIITFSLDGASADTHDALRGDGSFRRVLQAMSVCVAEQLPFSLNMVVTAHNRHELQHLVDLAERLGASYVRFNHLLPSPITTHQGADLSPEGRRDVEATIEHITKTAAIPVGMAPGHHTTDLFPCAPLGDREINIDVHGNLTKCCVLSGHGPGAGTGDIIGDLSTMSFGKAYERLLELNRRFRVAKQAHFAKGPVDTDYFPCWYCTLRYEKVNWLRNVPGHPWAALVPEPSGALPDWQPVRWSDR